MSTASMIESAVARHLSRGAAPLRRLAHSRHARALHQGAGIDAIQQSEAEAWWGDEPRWFPGGTPPRQYNRVVLLIHGDRYFAALEAALARAEGYVYLAAWCLTPHLPLARGGEEWAPTHLVDVLVETARRVPVRVLLWGGAAAFVQPTARAVAQTAQTIEAEAVRAGVDLHVRIDRRPSRSHCIHQKTVVVDGRVAFVGGMDLTSFAGDRWDTARHPLRAGPNWHDVQVQLEGEAVADVEENFRQRWEAVGGAGGELPPRAPVTARRGTTPVQVVRTIPHRVYPFAPDGEFGIHHAYVETLRRAERLIYLENQYLWSPEVMAALREAMARPHAGPFRIVIVLPARAYSGKWDNDRHVAQLRQADAGRGIVSVFCPYAWGPGSGRRAFAYRPIYVHAKVAVVDDEWLLVGSANLNDRGLITDGELDVLVHEPALARALRAELWAEHLGMTQEAVTAAEPARLVDDVWPAQATANAQTIARGEAPLVGTIHRYEVGRMPGSWLLEEAELLTLER